MTREISQFLINPDTDAPLTDVLRVSRVLDALASTEQSSIDEKFMLELYYRFATEEEPELLPDESSSKFLDWFNETKIEIYIEDEMPDEQYKQLEKKWQDLKK